jgi:hypothetical protein
MSLPPSIQARIDELKNVVNAGRPFWAAFTLMSKRSSWPRRG